MLKSFYMERDKKKTKKEETPENNNSDDNEKTISFNDYDQFPGKTREIFELSERKVPERGDSGQFPDILDYRRKSGLTDKENHLKFDRNFLHDAAPFKLDELMEEIKKTPSAILSGFENLDNLINIPISSISSVTGGSKTGKTIFLINLLLNIATIYDDYYFLFYSPGERKPDIEVSLINSSGIEKFIPEKLDDNKILKSRGINNNLDIWYYMLKEYSSEALMKKSEESPFFAGLNTYMKLADRIKIIDNYSDLKTILRSIDHFDQSHFKIGAVFIDSANLLTSGDIYNIPYNHYKEEIIKHLRSDMKIRTFPLIISYDTSSGEFHDYITENSSLRLDITCTGKRKEPGKSKKNTNTETSEKFTLTIAKGKENIGKKIYFRYDRQLQKLF